jgi:hypothetical protein
LANINKLNRSLESIIAVCYKQIQREKSGPEKGEKKKKKEGRLADVASLYSFFGLLGR